MSKTISLSLPHDLTQVEARARIEKGIANARATYGSRLGEVQEKWTDNHLDFHVRAAGQQVTGRLDVLPHDVKLEVDLPWMLALLAGKFTQQVEQEGQKLLEKK
ncbi:MAG TPA: polyhydroxyalkanoic acid system family protein [Tepidisphaeraceae bacterium]|nr:polyhydroxyalkanoic acid system family protein [Tepidisphaeraceae bacterium]